MSEYPIGIDCHKQEIDNREIREARARKRGKNFLRAALLRAVAYPVLMYLSGSAVVNYRNDARAIETAPLIETTQLPWKCYIGEKMLHWMPSYHAYLDRVVEPRKGHYLVPDVDRNGRCVVDARKE